MLIESPNITRVAIIRLPSHLILVVSVYISKENAQALQDTCNNLHKTIMGARRNASIVVDVVIVERTSTDTTNYREGTVYP